MSQKIFDEKTFMVGFPMKTRAFYARIWYMAELNLKAVRRGYFDVVLCDTDDVYSFARFVEQIPDIKLWLDIDDDMGWQFGY